MRPLLSLLWITSVLIAEPITAALTDQYIGCFQDRGYARIFPESMYLGVNNDTTLEWCINTCIAKHSAKYAGLENGKQCWCGNNDNYAQHGRLLDANCNVACGGDKDQTCGAYLKMQLYAANATLSRPADQENTSPSPTPDIDECTNNQDGCAQICVNTEGSFACMCKEGYKLATDGKKCTLLGDSLGLDRCSDNKAGCDHKCVSTQDIAYCECNAGYKLSGATTCVDIDECTETQHGCAQRCENTKGSFRCHCRDGYTLKTDGKTCSSSDSATKSGNSRQSTLGVTQSPTSPSFKAQPSPSPSPRPGPNSSPNPDPTPLDTIIPAIVVPILVIIICSIAVCIICYRRGQDSGVKKDKESLRGNDTMTAKQPKLATNGTINAAYGIKPGIEPNPDDVYEEIKDEDVKMVTEKTDKKPYTCINPRDVGGYEQQYTMLRGQQGNRGRNIDQPYAGLNVQDNERNMEHPYTGLNTHNGGRSLPISHPHAYLQVY